LTKNKKKGRYAQKTVEAKSTKKELLRRWKRRPYYKKQKYFITKTKTKKLKDQNKNKYLPPLTKNQA